MHSRVSLVAAPARVSADHLRNIAQQGSCRSCLELETASHPSSHQLVIRGMRARLLSDFTTALYCSVAWRNGRSQPDLPTRSLAIL